MEVLKRLKNIDDLNDCKKELHTLFNEQGFSDYMVVYLRLLTSGQLQKDQDFYSCFIEGDRTVSFILLSQFITLKERQYECNDKLLLFNILCF